MAMSAGQLPKRNTWGRLQATGHHSLPLWFPLPAMKVKEAVFYFSPVNHSCRSARHAKAPVVVLLLKLRPHSASRHQVLVSRHDGEMEAQTRRVIRASLLLSHSGLPGVRQSQERLWGLRHNTSAGPLSRGMEDTTQCNQLGSFLWHRDTWVFRPLGHAIPPLGIGQKDCFPKRGVITRRLCLSKGVWSWRTRAGDLHFQNAKVDRSFELAISIC